MGKKDKKQIAKTQLPKSSLSDWQKKLLEAISPEEIIARIDLCMEKNQSLETRLQALENRFREADLTINNLGQNMRADRDKISDLKRKLEKIWSRTFPAK